ncbi:unnamed protein product [Closterium sp. Yama58-4]|nr:unnamed protein product [Closterium sp. Yama58-4]
MAAAASMPAQRPRQRQRAPRPPAVQAEVWAQQRALERVAEDVEAEISRALAERRTDDAVRLLWRERQAGRWAGSRCWSRAVAQLSLRGQWRKAKRLIDEVCRAQMGGQAGGEGEAERRGAWEQQGPAGSAVGGDAGGSGEVFREVQVDEDAFGLAVMAAARSGCAADAERPPRASGHSSFQLLSSPLSPPFAPSSPPPIIPPQSASHMRPDTAAFNAAINAAVTAGDLPLAERLLGEGMAGAGVTPDAISFNILIKGRAAQGMPERAHELLKHMMSHGVQPDAASFNSVVAGYVACGMMREAQALVQTMWDLGEGEEQGQGEREGEAQGKREEEKGGGAQGEEGGKHGVGVGPNVRMLSILIKGLVASGDLAAAFEWFERMKQRRDTAPNHITYATLMHALVSSPPHLIPAPILARAAAASASAATAATAPSSGANAVSSAVPQAVIAASSSKPPALPPLALATAPTTAAAAAVVDSRGAESSLRRPSILKAARPSAVTGENLNAAGSEAGARRGEALEQQGLGNGRVGVLDASRSRSESDRPGGIVEKQNGYSSITRGSRSSSEDSMVVQTGFSNLATRENSEDLAGAGNLDELAVVAARQLLEEMRARGVAGNTAVLNVLVKAHCDRGQMGEVEALLKEMGCGAGPGAGKRLRQGTASSAAPTAGEAAGGSQSASDGPQVSRAASEAAAADASEGWYPRGGAVWGVRPNAATFASIIAACGRAGTWQGGQGRWSVRGDAVSGAAAAAGAAVLPQAAAGAITGSMTSDSNVVDSAEYSPRGSSSSSSSRVETEWGRGKAEWSRGESEWGGAEAAVQWFARMRREGIAPTVQVYTALISALGQAPDADPSRALSVFEEMLVEAGSGAVRLGGRAGGGGSVGGRGGAVVSGGEELRVDAAAWGAVIDSQARAGLVDQAWSLYQRAKSSLRQPPTVVLLEHWQHESREGRGGAGVVAPLERPTGEQTFLSPRRTHLSVTSRLQAASIAPTPATYGTLVRALAAAERAGEALVLWRDLKERLVGTEGSDGEKGLGFGEVEGGEGRWELMGERREGRAETVTWRAGVAGGAAKGAAGVCVDEAVMDGLMLIFMQAGYFQRALEVVGAMERAGLAPDKLKYKRMLITSLSSRRLRTLSSLSTTTAAADEFPGSRGFEALKFWLGLPNRLYESDWSWRD